MTTPVGSVRITAEADAGDFGDDLVSVVKDAMREVLAGVVSGMRQVNAELTGVDSTAFAGLSDEARRASRQVDDMADVLEQAARAVDGISPGDLGDVGDAAQRAARQVEELGDASREAGEDAERAAEKGGSAFEGMGEKAAAVAGGLAIGDIIGQSIDQANLPGRLQIQLGLTADEASRTATIAGDAFRSGFGESLDQVAEAAASVSGNIAAVGTVSDDTFKSMTESAILFAENMQIDVGEASKTAGLLMKNGLAKDGVEAFDLLTKAAQVLGPDLAQELPSLVDAYTIAFADIGLSGEETFNHFAVFAGQGVEAMDKAGDSVKEFGIKMKTMDEAAGETLTKLGIDADAAFAAFKKGGPDAQKQFEEVMAALRTSSDQTGDALALFGSPLEELGTDNIPKFIESLSTTGGAMDGFKGSMDTAKGANEGLSKSFSETLRTALGGVTDALQPVIQILAEHPGIVKAATFAVIAFAGAWAGMKVIGAITSVFTGVQAAITGTTLATEANTIATRANAIAVGIGGAAAWTKNTAAMLANKAATLAVSAATKTATAVQAAFNLVMSLNPIGLLVAAIAALVAGLVYFFTQTETGKKLLEGFFDFLSTAWDAVTAAWEAAVEFVSGVWDSIVEGGQQIIDFFVDLPGNIFEFLGGLGDQLVEWFGAAWDMLVAAVGTYFEVLSFIFTELPGKIIGWLGDLGSKLGEWFAAGWQLFTDGIGVVIDGIMFVFTELPGKIIGWLGDIGAKIGAWFSAGWELFKAGLGIVIDTVSTFFTELPGKIIGWAGDLAGRISAWFSEQWANFKAGLGIVIDSVSSFFTGLPGKILGWLGDLGKLLVNAGKNVIDGLVQGLRNAGSAVKDFLLGLMADAKDAVLGFFGIESPSKVFAEIGKNLMLGMAGGIEKNGDAVTGALASVNDAVAGTEFAAPSLSMDSGALDSAAAGEGAGAGLDPSIFEAFGEAAMTATEEQVAPSLTAITDGLTLTGETAAITANEQVVPALGFIGEQAMILAEQMGVAINDNMIPTAQSLGDAIQRTQAEGIQPAFNAIQGGLTTVQGAFQTGVNAIGATWDQLRAKTDTPVRFTVDNVFNKGLVGVWNHVSDFIGTEKMSTFSYASGGVTPGWSPGRDIHEFVSPTGGRLNLSGGEAIMVPEFTAAVGPEWVAWMNKLARSRGAAAVRRLFMGGEGVQAFADGGVWNSLWGAVNNKFPGMFSLTSSYRAGDPGHHGTGNAIDVSNGTDSTPEMRMLAQWIFESFGRAALELIHSPFNNNVKDGNNVGDGFGFYGADTMNQHRNHVHWAANGVTPGAGGPAYGPAFSMSDMVKEQAAAKWAEVEPAIKEFAASSAGMIAQMPAESLATVRAATDAKIEELAKAFDVPAGTGVERFRGLVSSLLANYGHPAGWVENTLRRMMQESGGDQNAVNKWDSNWTAGTPSVGLMQVIGPTYAANKDPKFDTGPYLYGTSTAPPANISASMQYTMRTYGSLPAGYDRAGGYFMGGVLPLGLFDTGGVVRPGSAAVNQSGRPERVLSPDQTEAFDNLVKWLTGGQLHIDWGNVESLIQQGIEVYREECKKDRAQEAQTTEATQSLSRDLGANGAVGKAIVDAANLSGDLMSVLDTSGLFAGRTVTLTAEEVRQKQIEEWQKFLDSLKAEHDKAATEDKAKGGTGKTFDFGGIISGPGLFASGTALPERVLSPRQTAAFEELVARITGPQMSVPSLTDRNGRELRPTMTAGDMHFHFPNAREPRSSGKAVESTMRDLLDR